MFIYLFAYIICKYFACIHFAMLVVLHAMFRGRAVANVGRTCSPTPLFVLIMYRGNKICLYYTCHGQICNRLICILMNFNVNLKK